PSATTHELERRQTEDSVRRAEVDRRGGGRVLDRRERAIEVPVYGAWAAEEHQTVVVPVQADLVTGGGDLGRKRGKAFDLLAGEKERRGHTEPLAPGEHRQRTLRLTPVRAGTRH